MKPQEQLAANLRRHRLRLSLSQEDLGHAAGLHPTEVSRLERAVRDPRLSTIARLARTLDLTASDLLKGA